MHYDEATNFLFDLRRFQVDPGTDAIRALLAELGDPHEQVTFVQVAGSNGKGSVTRMLASVLRRTAPSARTPRHTSRSSGNGCGWTAERSRSRR